MKRTTTSISTQPLNKAVFLDRDGTINSDEGHYYIYKPEDFVFNPGVIEGLKRLQKAGYLLIVITNQGGIAKGIYTREDMFKVHEKMCAELEKHGVTLTKIYYCPVFAGNLLLIWSTWPSKNSISIRSDPGLSGIAQRM